MSEVVHIIDQRMLHINVFNQMLAQPFHFRWAFSSGCYFYSSPLLFLLNTLGEHSKGYVAFPGCIHNAVVVFSALLSPLPHFRDIVSCRHICVCM